MKKLLLILGVALLGFTSCKKEKMIEESKTTYDMTILMAGSWGPNTQNISTFKINNTYLDYNDYQGTQTWGEVPLFGDIPYYSINEGDTLKFKSNSGPENTLIFIINNGDTLTIHGMYDEFEYIVP